MDRNIKAFRRYAQYYSAINYDGNLVISDKIVEKNKDCLWMEFSIKPTLISRAYKVLLVYVYGYQPYTYVIDPDIITLAEKRVVPHLYSQQKQRLCLTYPSYNEWVSNELITNTYLPWVALWLFYYEEWLLSDKWKGGGRHPGDETEEEIQESSKKSIKKKKVNKLSSLDIANNIYNKRKLKHQQLQKQTLNIEDVA